MARCRNLKPGFFTNERLAEVPPLVRLLFAGLWCIADREGRLEDRPKRIKAEILPYDDLDIDQSLDLLSRGDDPFIVRYQVAQHVKSDWQLATLFRIIDRRYRDLRPTWVTINAANAEEAQKRIAPNIIDRLTHGALVLRCNWQSYRSGR